MSCKLRHPLIRPGRLAFRVARHTVCRHSRWGLSLLLGLHLGLLGSVGSSGAAQSTTNETGSAELSREFQTRFTQAKAELSRFLSLAEVTTNLPAGATPAEAAEYKLLLESLVLSFEQQRDERVRLQGAKQRQQDFEQKAKLAEAPSEPPPYSILLVDGLRDSVQSLTATITASETTRQVLEIFAAEYQSARELSDGQLRRLTEELESSTDPSRIQRLNWQKRFEEARSRLAAANAELNQTRRQTLETGLIGCRQRLAVVRRQLAPAAQHTRFPQADLDRMLAVLAVERSELERELQRTELENQHRQEALGTARDDLQRILQNTAGSAPPSADRAAGIRGLQDVLELRTVQAETSAQRLVVLRQLLEVVLRQRGMWHMRFEAFGSQDPAKLQQGYKQLQHLAALLVAARPHFLQQIELAASLITEQRNRLRDQVAAPSERAQAEALLSSFQQREELAYRALRDLEKMERLARRWRESLDQERGALPFIARVQDLFTSSSSFASKLWQFELFAAQDTIHVDGQPITGRRSITVAKVTKAALMLGFGCWFSLLLARLLERLAIQRFKVERAQANLVRRWVGLILLVALGLFSLTLVKIPLTIFAFLGGALAIGLGFSTQNVLKNFISGILILFERPFRVGDVLDVEGRRGVVTSIGFRSSVLQLWDGTETLIPNSALLENTLTNWTYSNGMVRFAVAAGVAYGADSLQVAEVLADLARHHVQVERDPQPQVLFLQFGDNQLEFELRFWVDVTKHNPSQVASDLRHLIGRAFAERGLQMAFPQRDIHLDAAHPLRVQLMSADKDLPSTRLCSP